MVDRRAAYGKPRVVNFGDQQEDGGGVVQGVEEDDEEEDGEGEECSREEVILITGGCSGLGRLLAEIFGLRGLGVAVLDVKEPEGGKERAEEEEGWKWYRCDVGDLEDVQRVKGEVQRDVCIPNPSLLRMFILYEILLHGVVSWEVFCSCSSYYGARLMGFVRTAREANDPD